MLCGVSDEWLLIASHIKSWSHSSHKERLDVTCRFSRVTN
ncbi:hypothetical protein [Bacillus cereus]